MVIEVVEYINTIEATENKLCSSIIPLPKNQINTRYLMHQLNVERASEIWSLLNCSRLLKLEDKALLLVNVISEHGTTKTMLLGRLFSTKDGCFWPPQQRQILAFRFLHIFSIAQLGLCLQLRMLAYCSNCKCITESMSSHLHTFAFCELNLKFMQSFNISVIKQ